MNPVLYTVLLFLGAFLFFFVINLILESRLTSRLSDLERPQTIAWLKAGVFTSVGVMFSGLLQSILSTEKVLQQIGEYSHIQILSFAALFLGIAIISYILIFILCAVLYTFFSSGRGIFVETANDNMAAVALFVGILIGTVLAIKEGLPLIYEEFIPYPTIPRLF